MKKILTTGSGAIDKSSTGRNSDRPEAAKTMLGGALSACLLLASSAAYADVYRCSGADGRTVYQEAPCTTGSQRKLDDAPAKARQSAEVAGNNEQEEVRKAGMLKWCLSGNKCDAATYAMYLRGMRKFLVIETLGPPASVQNIGGDEVQYFNVPTSEGRMKARLQVIYLYGKADKVNAY